MTWRELREWVNQNRRMTELRACAGGLGVQPGRSITITRQRVLDHINAQPDQDSQASWQPGQTVSEQPAPAPVPTPQPTPAPAVPPRQPPAPPQPPPPPAPRPPARMPPWNWFGFVAVAVAAAIALGLFGYYAWRMVSIAPLPIVAQEAVLPEATPTPTTTPIPPGARVVTQPTATPVPPTATPTPRASTATLAPAPMLYESEGGLPTSGSTWSFDVAPREIEVLTGGPASIAGINLSGGTDQGSIVVMLPGKQVTQYAVTNLVAGANWHGAYLYDREVTEADWRTLVEDRVQAMRQVPNCSTGKGCKVVDVVVVGPGPMVLAQWTK